MPNNPQKLLFVCTNLGVRSLFAAGFATNYGSGRFEVFASSYESGRIPKRIHTLLEEVGIPVSSHNPKTVFQRKLDNETFDFVVILCNNEDAEQCPLFRKSVAVIYGNEAELINWNIPDFRSISDTDIGWMDAARKIRDEVRSNVLRFLESDAFHPQS
jgi:arsenate reductase